MKINGHLLFVATALLLLGTARSGFEVDSSTQIVDVGSVTHATDLQGLNTSDDNARVVEFASVTGITDMSTQVASTTTTTTPRQLKVAAEEDSKSPLKSTDAPQTAAKAEDVEKKSAELPRELANQDATVKNKETSKSFGLLSKLVNMVEPPKQEKAQERYLLDLVKHIGAHESVPSQFNRFSFI